MTILAFGSRRSASAQLGQSHVERPPPLPPLLAPVFLVWLVGGLFSGDVRLFDFDFDVVVDTPDDEEPDEFSCFMAASVD